jgi:hypothetical protein
MPAPERAAPGDGQKWLPWFKRIFNEGLDVSLNPLRVQLIVERLLAFGAIVSVNRTSAALLVA